MTQSKRREDLATIRRESIIDAAERVFFRRGYKNATVDEIVKEAEYSKRTVYTYIKSKEEMYDAVALRAYSVQYAYLFAGRQGHDAMADLESVILNAMRFAEECPHYNAVIMNYHIRLNDSPDNVLREINEMDARMLGVIEEIISRGIKEGVFRKELNSSFTATYLAAVFIGAVDMVTNKRHYLEHDRGMTPEIFIKNTLEMLMRSLRN